jgi:hypothetical protein
VCAEGSRLAEASEERPLFLEESFARSTVFGDTVLASVEVSNRTDRGTDPCLRIDNLTTLQRDVAILHDAALPAAFKIDNVNGSVEHGVKS